MRSMFKTNAMNTQGDKIRAIFLFRKGKSDFLKCEMCLRVFSIASIYCMLQNYKEHKGK